MAREGGQSTLIVRPTGQSLFIDAVWAGNGAGFHPGDSRQTRDANRIVAAGYAISGRMNGKTMCHDHHERAWCPMSGRCLARRRYANDRHAYRRILRTMCGLDHLKVLTVP